MTQPTKKQAATRERNWQIFKLRGLWYNLPLKNRLRVETIRNIIDRELEDMGAESETKRRLRIKEFIYSFEAMQMSEEEFQKELKKIRKSFGDRQ